MRPVKKNLLKTIWTALLGCAVGSAIPAHSQTNCVPPAAGIVGWWPAEGNASDVVSNTHGAPINGTGFVAGKVGQAFSLDGINDAVTNAVPGLTNVLSSYTIEFWAWPVAGRASTPETASGVAGDSNQRYAIFPNNGKFGPAGAGVSVGTNGVSVFEHGSAYLPSLLVYDTVLNGWTHIAVVYSNQQPSLYVNGVLVRTGLLSSRASYPSTCFGDADGLGYGYYAGLLDEVSIYNRTLSAAEVAAIFNAGTFGKCPPGALPVITAPPTNQTVALNATATFTVMAAGAMPLAYQWRWHGTNLPGATLTALSLPNVQTIQAGPYSVQVSNIYGIVISSNALLSVTSPPCVTVPSGLISWWPAEGNGLDSVGANFGFLGNGTAFTNGTVGAAFSFDGADDIVVVSNSPALNFGVAADFSIETWIRLHPNAAAFGVNSIVDKREGSGRGYEFGVAGGHLNCRLSDAADMGTPFGGAGGPDLRDSLWHHVAVTLVRNSPTGGTFYVDGVVVGIFDPTVEAGSLSNAASLFIAQNSTGVNTDFTGSIDELSIYGRALSAAEIQAIFSAGGSGKCQAALAPFFSIQPTNQSAIVGSNVTFIALAGGSPPPAYQWRFNGTNIGGATTNSLTLTNVQSQQAGTYSVLATNASGSAISSNALLTVNFPPAVVRIQSTNSTAASFVSVPVTLAANGNENALAFSLNFEAGRLTYAGATPGSGGAQGSLIVNTSSTNLGRLGLGVALPPGSTFPAGTQEVVSVNFWITNLAAPVNSGISFGDQPTLRQLLGAGPNLLPAWYSNGTVSISVPLAFESDVFPRSNGDTNVNLADWLMVGRYVARLDVPTNSAEFQRADCAPRATRGNGTLRTSDWVQAGRYASGLEPQTAIGGPTNELVVPGPGPSLNRLLTLSDLTIAPDGIGTSSVVLTALGNENAVGFSVSFDSARVSFEGAQPGSGAGGSFWYLNTNQLVIGRVGAVLALPTGVVFTPGQQSLLQFSFRAGPTPGPVPLSFNNTVVPREVSDFAGNALPVGYIDGSITVGAPPSLSIARQGTNIIVAWPLSASNYVLQQALGNLTSTSLWLNVNSSPISSNNQLIIQSPITSTNRYFRLYKL